MGGIRVVRDGQLVLASIDYPTLYGRDMVAERDAGWLAADLGKGTSAWFYAPWRLPDADILARGRLALGQDVSP